MKTEQKSGEKRGSASEASGDRNPGTRNAVALRRAGFRRGRNGQGRVSGSAAQLVRGDAKYTWCITGQRFVTRTVQYEAKMGANNSQRGDTGPTPAPPGTAARLLALLAIMMLNQHWLLTFP